ncbi:MAG: 7-cyano-7-deazaguanine synthase [bacterium]|nr:7-cyano-7-deazaguanine synthase [bacterium]
MNQPVVCLVSGGLDSAVMVGEALAGGRAVHPLYVRQGGLWEDAEQYWLECFLATLAGITDDDTLRPRRGAPNALAPGALAPLTVLRFDWPPGYASRWALDAAVPPPDESTPDAAVYLPGRNLALLLQGAMLAQSVGAEAVSIGLLRGNPFPDAADEFLRAFERTFTAATGRAVRVETPLRALDKSDLIRRGAALPLGLTFSCLRPVDGRHCGVCNKCAERRGGFERAGLPDPTLYA